MKLNCLLVDDEPPALKILASYVEGMDNLELAGQCYNAFEAMQALQRTTVDIIFLDINMPRLLGTEFIRTLRHPPKVIFTTAHKDYALESYELNAVDYLLKPFSLERFVRAINKISYENEAQAVNAGERLSAVTDTRPMVFPDDAFLYFRSDRKMIKVMLDEIVYIESLKDYIRIVRTGYSPLLVKQSISMAEEMLPDKLFVRIHRSFIVSLKKVTAYTQNDVEIGGIEIPIGKLYKHRIGRLGQPLPNTLHGKGRAGG
jgi:DNA-binding LytR/AlgR family response regulator